MRGDQRQNASRDWLRAMQATAHATARKSRTLACVLDERAMTHGDRTALISRDQTLTYRQLAERVNRYARFAIENGLCNGGCAALLMPNSPDYIAAWAGITATGGIAALINTNLRGKSLAHAIGITQARSVIVSASLLDAYLSALPHLGTAPTLLVNGSHDGTVGPERSIEQELARFDGSPISDAERHGVTLSDRALYIFTSGTTGLPKAANVSHGRIIEWSTWFSGLMNTQSSDRMYDCLPMYHSVGGVVAPGSVLVSGGSVVIRERFSATQFWNDIAEHDCTLFQYIGDLCRYLLASATCPAEAEHSLRVCCGNGLRGDIWEQFQSRFRIPRILEFYAATEGSFSLYNVEGKPGAIGRLTGMMARKPPLQIVKFDPNTGLPARGSDGLCVRCADDEPGEALGALPDGGEGSRFEGYTSSEESERKIVRDVMVHGDRWFRSGDLMSRDSAGFFYFVDRVGDTFRWKGENVSTLEVANALASYPGIVNATVYGVEILGHDGRAGMAAIETDGDIDGVALYGHLSNLLPSYARPVFIRIVEAIEATETFKPKKQLLIAEGFDPAIVTDRLFFADNVAKSYVPLTAEGLAKLTNSRAAA